MSEQKVPRSVEQRIVIKFLVGENVPSAEIHHRLQQQYGEECLRSARTHSRRHCMQIVSSLCCSHLLPVSLYHIFPRYCINGTIFEKKKYVIEHKMCVLSFSVTFIWNISHSKKNQKHRSWQLYTAMKRMACNDSGWKADNQSKDWRRRRRKRRRRTERVWLYTFIGLHVKCPLFLSHFNATWIFSTDFSKNTEM